MNGKCIISYQEFGVAEIRPDKDPIVFFTGTEEECIEERERCMWKGDFTYALVEITQKLEGRMTVNLENEVLQSMRLIP